MNSIGDNNFILIGLDQFQGGGTNKIEIKEPKICISVTSLPRDMTILHS